jgi:hypothetical protein
MWIPSGWLFTPRLGMSTYSSTVPYQSGFGWDVGMRRSNPTTSGPGSSFESVRLMKLDQPPPLTASDFCPCVWVFESASVGVDEYADQSESDSNP